MVVSSAERVARRHARDLQTINSPVVHEGERGPHHLRDDVDELSGITRTLQSCGIKRLLEMDAVEVRRAATPTSASPVFEISTR